MTGQHIVNYLRQSQSADALRLALSEVAQLSILEEDDLLLDRYDNDRTTVYTFENNTYTVRYSHEKLEPGQWYAKGTVIGEEYIRVYAQEAGSNEQWWRQLDWSEGLVLGGAWTGLVIPNSQVEFYGASDWVDSAGVTRVHVRADFANDQPELQDRFWEQVHSAEERTEIALSDTPELSAITTQDGGRYRVARLNMLDFYFRYLYGDRGIVVDLMTMDLGDTIHKAVVSFLRREIPIGSVPIVRLCGQQDFQNPVIPIEPDPPIDAPDASGGEEGDPPLP